tara:strand:- start:2344 stop:2535 length:192 start_codon:yes stop_codon:yes gene_type:complete
MTKQQFEKAGDEGHGSSTPDNYHKVSKQISKKIKENILSGRWPATTPKEVEMLRAHRAKTKKK